MISVVEFNIQFHKYYVLSLCFVKTSTVPLIQREHLFRGKISHQVRFPNMESAESELWVYSLYTIYTPHRG